APHRSTRRLRTTPDQRRAGGRDREHRGSGPAAADRPWQSLQADAPARHPRRWRMMRTTRATLVALALGLAAPGGLAPAPLHAQDDGVVLDFGAPPARPAALPTIPDSIVARALELFNAPPPATSRSYGGTVQVAAAHEGNYGAFQGDLLVLATVHGSVVVINGDLRVTASGRITGDVIVLGGRFAADDGAQIDGRVIEYRRRAPVRREPDGRLAPAEPAP